MHIEASNLTGDQNGDTLDFKDFLKAIYICYLPMICISNVIVIAGAFLTKSLHSPHDCIIAGLAVVDFLVGALSIPFYLAEMFSEGIPDFHNDSALCKLSFFAKVMPQELSLCVISAMCVNRFVALNFPVLYRNKVDNRRVIVALVVLCLVQVSWEILVYIGLYNYDPSFPLEERCTHDNTPTWYKKYAMVSYEGVLLFVSLCLCINIVLVSKKRTRQMRRVSRVSQNYTNVTLSVAFIFIILWLPSIFGSFVSYNILMDSKDFLIYMYICQLLRLTNSLINAPVYAISRRKYRSVYKKLLLTPLWKWSKDKLMSRVTSSTPCQLENEAEKDERKRIENLLLQKRKIREEEPEQEEQQSHETTITTTTK